MNQRELFFRHLAQTSTMPIGLEIASASGVWLQDVEGRKYLDLIGGISVCNIGHRHPKVVNAIRDQVDQYLHVLVYGEFIQSPQVQYATLLVKELPQTLNSVYFTNSGTEATEGALKLAKRATGRTEIIAFSQSYHGSTQGSLSVMGDEYWRNAFRPLLPGVLHLEYGTFESLDSICDKTCCVIAETVQAERGVIAPSRQWLQELRKRTADAGALLILDEIQTGFGRTGSLWNFQQASIVPDILLLGKALGGGMPLGAFIAEKKMMASLSHQPVLGHITTFGGHPVCCAAGMAAFQVLLENKLFYEVAKKEQVFRSLLVHPKIKAVRSAGLLIAVEFDSFEVNKKIIDACLSRGLLTDWFLFAPQCMRIAPPLIIKDQDIHDACGIIAASCDL